MLQLHQAGLRSFVFFGEGGGEGRLGLGFGGALTERRRWRADIAASILTLCRPRPGRREATSNARNEEDDFEDIAFRDSVAW